MSRNFPTQIGNRDVVARICRLGGFAGATVGKLAIEFDPGSGFACDLKRRHFTGEGQRSMCCEQVDKLRRLHHGRATRRPCRIGEFYFAFVPVYEGVHHSLLERSNQVSKDAKRLGEQAVFQRLIDAQPVQLIRQPCGVRFPRRSEGNRIGNRA